MAEERTYEELEQGINELGKLEALPPEVKLIVDKLKQKIGNHRLTINDLRYQKNIVPLVLDISKDLISLPIKNIDEGINRALKKIALFSRAVRSSLFITSEDQIEITNTHEWCDNPDDYQIDLLQEIPFKTFGYYKDKLLHFESVVINNLNDLPAEATGERVWIKKHGFRSLLFVPLILEKKLYGTLGFYGKIGEELVWPPQYITLLQLISDMFVRALERKKTEEDLRESREMLRTLSDQSLMGIIVLQDELFVYVNGQAAKIMEVSAEEIARWSTKQYAELIHPDDLDFVMEQGRKKQSGEDGAVTHYSWRMVTPGGKLKWIDMWSQSITFAGRDADMVTMIDITERKKGKSH